jgi:hypothetical protein
MERALKDRSTKNGLGPMGAAALRTPQETRGSRASNAESIADGLQFIFGLEQDQLWALSDIPGLGAEVWVTAYVLARLGDVPASFLTPLQYERIEQAIAWLEQARSRDGRWGLSASAAPDAESTAWVMVALRRYGRPVPHSVTTWLRSCSRPDGGFALHPADCSSACCQQSNAGITAVVAKAMGDVDASMEQFLVAQLQNVLPDGASAGDGQTFVCSEILDCASALAPWSLLNGVCRLATLDVARTPLASALLLRSLLRLRMRRALHVADSLRAMQQTNGSWPGDSLPWPLMANVMAVNGLSVTDTSGLLATATSLSALGMAQSQHGLYVGAGQPRPNRMPEL